MAEVSLYPPYETHHFQGFGGFRYRSTHPTKSPYIKA